MLSFLSGQSVAEEQLIFWMAVVLAFLAIFVVFLLQFMKATYGRYSDPAHGKTINVKVAWVLQESPALLIPLTLLLFTDSVQTKTTVNIILCGLFIIHYVQRTLIFPCLIRGGKDTPMLPFVLAMFFCIFNGYMQGRYLTKYAEYPSNWISDSRFLFGVCLFFVGMFINLHSDYILRNLRKPGETGYKIPKGGMFNYISGANFFGEIVEWLGFAMAVWSFTAFSFFLFTLCNIGPRACHHHRYYREKFDDYPKSRKAVIPFIL
ncbi:3-oxo-5-alpha-steroid 4-dehydrogenase 1-like [Anneissia japonica]|uniref:3-oxo-5-alpha-steroid 4-dehydrogenase 1-like n=1 Tax=Anneissia japonica TaxID=1529436 RepID=UPI001425514D|nr:3-oxo-5-alpha-steroid 4-dehydrogenase 1-like [Anneissia japonica]XP_033127761.1 3-oxo-5-alpha-steroid 4-dehydrogenase 1-like [Anneissia japonica]